MNPARLTSGCRVGLNPGSTHRRLATRREQERLEAELGVMRAVELFHGPWVFERWQDDLAVLRAGMPGPCPEPSLRVVVHHNDLRAAPLEDRPPWRRGPILCPLTSRGMLLQALVAGPGGGCELIERVKGWTGGTVELEQGSVYPTLRALEREGLVEQAPSASAGRRGGRPKVCYRLTQDGRDRARNDRATLTALTAAPLEDQA